MNPKSADQLIQKDTDALELAQAAVDYVMLREGMRHHPVGSLSGEGRKLRELALKFKEAYL
jgi:hypothetical protein